MPTHEVTTNGSPCWIELFTTDPAVTRPFYEQLFGWSAEEPNPEFGGYFNFAKDGAKVAGGMANDGSSGTPDVWSIYLAMPDATKAVEAAEAAGAAVYVPAMEVMTLGTMAVVADAGGASIGIWQPGEHKGFEVVNEPGTPAYFELLTRDYAEAVSFYQNVFGWQTSVVSDTPEFRYTGLGEGDRQVAGIMDGSGFLPDGVPAHWSVYFDVADTDATSAKAVELGGTVVDPAQDTPYGRLATIADPTGAAFKLKGPNT